MSNYLAAGGWTSVDSSGQRRMSGQTTVDDVSCQLMTVARVWASSGYLPPGAQRGTSASGPALDRLQLYCTGPRGRRLSSGDWPTVGRARSALNWASGPTSYLNAGRPPGQLLYDYAGTRYYLLLVISYTELQHDPIQ